MPDYGIKYTEFSNILKGKDASGNGTAIFYSGADGQNQKIAEECQEEHSADHYTIFQTEAGEYLDKTESIKIALSNGELTPDGYRQLWAEASEMFAHQAQGNVIMFTDGIVWEESILVKNELKILLDEGHTINSISNSELKGIENGSLTNNFQKVLDKVNSGSHDGCDDMNPPPDSNSGYTSKFVETLIGLAGALYKIAGVNSSCDPLIIDLKGDGIKLDSWQDSNALFDLTSDGIKENTGWTKADGDDAFLVIDKNNDGKVNDITEMFGNASIPGFRQLSTYDSNKDGVINASDSQFNLLKLWNDKNANGTVDAGELTALAQNNITSISLNAYGNISVIRNIINKHSNLAAAANDNCVDSLFSRVKIA